MEISTDVLVIGGCTAGLYFAACMARQGYKVLVCEKDAEKDNGAQYDIIHLGREQFKRFGLYEPQEGDPEYVARFTMGYNRSALNNWPKKIYNDVLVLRRQQVIKRLSSWAKEKGAEIMYGAVFEKPLFNSEGKLAGALFHRGNEEISVYARLCADASGIPAVLRTSLPERYGIETFTTGPRDQFYVVLHYVNLKNPEKDKVELNTTWTHYKTWLAPQHGKGGAIMGIGANLSFEYAERCFQRFAAKGFLPEYTLEHIEQGSTPYRRPPHSFVADGFVVLGSAACISNPWSGEGVPYGWLLCSIASEEFGKAMKDGAYPARENVWAVNKRYITEQGALFAKNLAMLSGAVSCTEKENDYEYQHSIIYEDDDEKGKGGGLIAKLLKGFLAGGISLNALGNLLSASGIGEKIFKHYMAFPGCPAGFASWVQKADKLWAKTSSMASLAEKDLVS
ncbi:MAG: FAD-dependent monooxygenase [Treponema sp.]|jgi:flavin-dependent dehydrogenase|nr:FAD-dependent monooxygenase [Treponema sp.]